MSDAAKGETPGNRIKIGPTFVKEEFDDSKLYLRLKKDPHFGPQVRMVFDQENCDICSEFLGFTNIYRHLSSIVPMERTIIDFGCAYAPQSYYFRQHAKYVGIDIFVRKRFTPENGVHFLCSIQEFLEKHKDDFPRNAFAICSYVPGRVGEDNIGMVKAAYQDVFTFYPSNAI